MESFTTLQYLTSKEHGCCNTKELMQASVDDKKNGTNDVQTLKDWARAEMLNKGIEVK
jgi:hypothetical protein